jgi:lysophospholipase L1-like esterase
LDQVARSEPNVFLGPDTDTLGDDMRFDGCHLNDDGLQRAADAWAEALAQRGIVSRR